MSSSDGSSPSRRRIPPQARDPRRRGRARRQSLCALPKLSEAEIKTLVVERKWLAALETMIHTEIDRVSQSLTQRAKELAERYEAPLPQLTAQVESLEARVAEHLESMGFAWKWGAECEVFGGAAFKQTELG